MCGCALQALQSVQIATIVAGFGYGCFQNEGLAAQFGVGKDAAEGIQADVTLADVGVTIDTRAEGSFGIVGVNDVDVGEPQHRGSAFESGAETGGRGDIEAGGEQMAGIEAVADGEAGEAARKFTDGLELFEAAADVGAGAGGIFQEQGDATDVQAVDGFAEGQGEGCDAFVDGSAAMVAGMEDEVVGADEGGAFEFAAKGGNRLCPDDGVDGGEIDKIVDMNDKRVEIEAFAGGAEQFDLLRIGWAGAPHARAGGEDLKGVGAEPGRG